MNRTLAFIVLFLLILLLCATANAQWEGAQVQRLTFNSSTNKVMGLCIDKSDKLYLFYHQRWWNPDIQPYRDTTFLITKEKGGIWSEPERISREPQETCVRKSVWYDPITDLIHLFSDCGETLFYTNSSVSNWESVKTDSGENRVHIGDVDFDSLGNIHVVWNVNFDSVSWRWDRVMYANNSSGEWVKQQIVPSIFLGGMNSGTSYLGVQKNGTAHVLYCSAVYPELQASYARNDSLNGTTWHTDTIPRPDRILYSYFGAPLVMDENDTLHLFTGGCTVPECFLGAGFFRTFYYRKHSQDETWQGPDLVLDSLMYFSSVVIDTQSVPYLAEWDPYTRCWFFNDRKPGFWQEPYQIMDTSSICNSLSSTWALGFSFVLDSEGEGHGVFEGCLGQFVSQDDSLEIFYYGTPFTSIDDDQETEGKLRFELSQNYPNPFNQNTLIRYSLHPTRSVPVSLKIYNILGKEVRELVNTTQSTGNYLVYWDGKDNSRKEVASGIYFYLLRAGERNEGKKMLLIK